MNRDLRTMVRSLLILAGGVLCGGGLLVVLAVTIGSDTQIEILQNPAADTLVATAFFTITFVLATLVWTLHWTVRIDRPETLVSESFQAPPQVESEFDVLVGNRLFGPQLTASERRHIRTRLRDAAIQTVARVTDCERQAAHEQITHGTWTDDAAAAAFLGTMKPSLPVRIRQVIPGNWWFTYGARRTARAIIRHADDDESVGQTR